MLDTGEKRYRAKRNTS